MKRDYVVLYNSIYLFSLVILNILASTSENCFCDFFLKLGSNYLQ